MNKIQALIALAVSGIVTLGLVSFESNPQLTHLVSGKSLQAALPGLQGSSAFVAPSAPAGGEDRIADELRASVTELAQLIAKNHLNARKLQEGALEMPQEKFLAGLPEEVRPAYARVLKMVNEAQNSQLARDGKDRSFFTRAKDAHAMPTYVSRHLDDLAGVQLNPQVTDFVAQVGNADLVRDEDIRQLLSLCARRRDCVEKSAASWITKYHKNLSNDQLRLIAHGL